MKTANQTGQRRDVYLKYDLSTLSRKITSAKLRIFAGLSIAIVVSLVVAASVFVQQQLARNNDRAEASQATQGNGDVPIAPSSGPQMLLNNPDGVEFERTIVTDAPSRQQ